MKKAKILFLGIIAFVMMPMFVNAESFSLSSNKSNVAKGDNYTVTLNYSGSPLGSATFSVSFKNASCYFTPANSKMTYRCNDGVCEVTLGYIDGGYKAGKFGSLSCSSAATGSAIFEAKVVNGDAWDESGMNSITINSAATTVTITMPTTTTTTTTRAPSTTKAPVTTKQATTATTKKGETTTKGTTTTATTVPVNSPGEVQTEPVTEEIVETTTTTRATTKKVSLEDLRLREFKIVGYDFDYALDIKTYTISVDEKVKELYITASAIDSGTTVEGIGTVNIEGKDTISIKVKNSSSGNEIEYVININREKEKSSLLLPIGLFIGGLFIGIVGTSIVKKNNVSSTVSNEPVLEPVKEEVVSPVVPDQTQAPVQAPTTVKKVVQVNTGLTTINADAINSITNTSEERIDVPVEDTPQVSEAVQEQTTIAPEISAFNAQPVEVVNETTENINGLSVVTESAVNDIFDGDDTNNVSPNQTVVSQTEKIVNTGVIDIPQNEKELAQVFSSYNEN